MTVPNNSSLYLNNIYQAPPVKPVPVGSALLPPDRTDRAELGGVGIAGQLALRNEKNPLPDAVKLQHAQQMTLDLFKRFGNDRQALFAYLKNTLGIKVVEADKTPWAKKMLEQGGALAMCMMSDGAEGPLEHRLRETGLLDEATIAEMKKPGTIHVLVSSPNVRNNQLYHELFHMNQLICGLSSADISLSTADFRDSIITRFTRSTPSLVSVCNQGTWWLTKHRLGLVKELPGGQGDELRKHARFERSAYDFLLRHAEMFQLNDADKRMNRNGVAIYKTIENCSWQLDKKQVR